MVDRKYVILVMVCIYNTISHECKGGYCVRKIHNARHNGNFEFELFLSSHSPFVPRTIPISLNPLLSLPLFLLIFPSHSVTTAYNKLFGFSPSSLSLYLSIISLFLSFLYSRNRIICTNTLVDALLTATAARLKNFHVS
jgi:hypothetical protein